MINPEDRELKKQKARLSKLEAQLADRELALASLRADSLQFQAKYLESVGRRFAQLDELEAKIAECLAENNPESKEAQKKAQEARSHAEESSRSAGEDETATPRKNSDAVKGIRELYRQAAKAIHPDLTLDGDERKRRHAVMSEVNEAYEKGDVERIRSILQDWKASPENIAGDGPGAELVRVIRKIAQVKNRLAKIGEEIESLQQSELFKLKQLVDEARQEGRDLLAKMAADLDMRIDRARQQLETLQEGKRK